MRCLPAVPVLLLAAVPAAAQSLRTVTWSSATKPAGAALVPADGTTGFARLRVGNATGKPLQVTLATLPAPPITTPYWAVRGQVRSEAVVGQAFLEMWNLFPGGGRFFSRTLGAAGPMRHLEGTQGWRPFALPFQSQPGHPPPSELVVNVFLPGAGQVEVGPLDLVQYDSPAKLLSLEGQWFGGPRAGLLGGLLGGLAGLLGGAIGWCTSRGRARSFVLAAFVALIALGAVTLAAGLAALAAHQPVEVWGGLAAAGALCLAVPAGLLRSVVRRYRELELRRMRALDAP